MSLVLKKMVWKMLDLVDSFEVGSFCSAFG